VSEHRRGFSPDFLDAVVAELRRVERAYDRLDKRIEQAKRQSTKDRLSAERARWVAYEKQLRELLR
jgi:hypothetical protein